MHTVNKTIANGSGLLGERVQVQGIFVMNREFAYFVESIGDRGHHAGLRVDLENIRNIIALRVLPRVGGAYQYSDEARIVGKLQADEAGFAFKLSDIEKFDINKLGEWRTVIP